MSTISKDFIVKNGIVVGTNANIAGSVTATSFAGDGSALTGILANYTLPTATTSILGGVKVDGTTITIASGVIGVSGALTSATQFKGNWDASTNTPTLSSILPAGTSAGWEYIVSVGATRDIGNGSTVWSVGDFVIYDGAKWVRIPSSSNVVSFNTRQGAITLTSGDVTTALGFTPVTSAAQVAHRILAGPPTSGSATPTYRALVADDVPILDQDTLGTAAGLSTTLIATSGGTGIESYTTGDILYASATNVLSKLASTTDGYILTAGGVGVAPSWAAPAETTPAFFLATMMG
ncbi:hypothetical protein UFOVP1666_63 [uncultured Caudovirales phage]|uniref:Uncharacterized protein n=1 Tax=uncultured Caudovirales phage TaxID=2100421 RepID=A0A6J5PEC3_9CAUD|nr:hypothetical protein UFOVP867_18 [uncultured Caudovirales phage]CAB4171069.1 hypothetical protein UFOVP913_180 [uncultured Caudovirales phage]CAB4176524.1 hypothetical protein UFOVP993_36 [uncultured Caudovirales phage]CAB4223020.1 hypothetical protein UFOVP1666_63 [uncultured Caudovirales phage]